MASSAGDSPPNPCMPPGMTLVSEDPLIVSPRGRRSRRGVAARGPEASSPVLAPTPVTKRIPRKGGTSRHPLAATDPEISGLPATSCTTGIVSSTRSLVACASAPTTRNLFLLGNLPSEIVPLIASFPAHGATLRALRGDSMMFRYHGATIFDGQPF